MIYADFESILKKVQKICRNNSNESCTNKYQEHTACSYGYKVVSIDDGFSEPTRYNLQFH